MSHLKYSNYEGYGERHSSSISQAVCIGDRIEISGQGKSSHPQKIEWLYTGPPIRELTR